MKKALGIITGILLLLLLAAYGAGCYYFQSHFFYGTVIDGVVYGCLDEPRVRGDLIRRQADFELNIQGRYGLTDCLKGADAGCVLEPQKELLDILARQVFYLWPLGFLESHVYELKESIQMEEDAFLQAAESLSIFASENMVPPQDARLSTYSPKDKGYYIVKEVEGNRIHKDEAMEAIREALKTGETELILTDAQYYDSPRLRSDDEGLIQRAERLNAYTQLTFTYNMHGVEVVVDGDQIHRWLVEKGNQVLIDEEKVKAYVQKLADLYDTYGKPRKFTTVESRKLELKSGAYGWKLDVEAEQEALLSMLAEKKDARREPEWLKKGYVEGETDIGDNYVEIDLGKQHLYLIRDGEIALESKLVSGNMSRGWGTPSGVFGITYKTRNAVLRGADYATPVSYWIPFNRNIGMHDATWRGSFGGNIYKTNGSHGCINLPFSKAKEIYNLVETNMPVVCYY